MASSLFSFFSYHNDARSNKHHICLEVLRKWRGAHVLQWYVIVLLSTSDGGLLGSYTASDEFVTPRHRSKPPAWIKNPVDPLINTYCENLKHQQQPCRCSAVHGFIAGGWAYGVWWSVKGWVFICLNISVTRSAVLTKVKRRTKPNMMLWLHKGFTPRLPCEYSTSQKPCAALY